MPLRTGFTTALAQAVAPSESSSPLVVLANLDADDAWAAGLPRIAVPRRADHQEMLIRMGLLGALLGRAGDVVLLPHDPAEALVAHWRSWGLAGGELVGCRTRSTGSSHPIAAAQDLSTLDQLRGLSERGFRLLPAAATVGVEALASACGLQVQAAPAALARLVNDKTWSRAAAERLGLAVVPGVVCSGAEQIAGAVRARGLRLPVILKDAHGGSGSGNRVVSTGEELEEVVHALADAERRAGSLAEIVVEEVVPDVRELNVQVLVSRGSPPRRLRTRELRAEGGAPRSHVTPPRLPEHLVSRANDAVMRLAAALREEGYVGLAGFDVLLSPDSGGVFPASDLNARLNLSSYFEPILDAWGPARGCSASWMVRLPQAVEAEQLVAALESTCGVATDDPERPAATVAAFIPGAGDFESRAYLVAGATDHRTLGAVRDTLTERVAALGDGDARTSRHG